jgi:UDP-glucose 4-epimerase
MTQKLKAVVTGGCGFIGSHIAEALLERGYEVVIIDDLSTGKAANISHFYGSRKVEMVVGSILNRPLLESTFEGAEYIFHQAAIPSVPRSIADPAATNEANVTGTLNVLMAARSQGAKKVVYASSSSVYGETPELPKVETMPTNPLSPYAVSKLAGENYCRAFAKVYGLRTASLRYFNVFGPRQDPDSQYSAVVPKFIKAVLLGQAPVIYGDGEQTRDFTYVKDVARANIMAAETSAAGTYNIGGGKRVSLNQLVKLVLKMAGREDIRPVYEAERAGDIKHSLADITKAPTFGWRPEFSLEEGLGEILKGLKK